MGPGVGADFAHGAGTIIGAAGALRKGWGDKGAYDAAAKNTLAENQYENKIYKQNAQNAKGAAQRSAIEQDRQAKLAISRAVAVAAGSGAGASDPTVNKLVGDIAARGEYNALSALYSGDSEAQYYQNVMAANKYNAESNAAAYRYKGAASSGWDEAMGTILSGGSSFLKKYGEDDSTDQPVEPGVFDYYKDWTAGRINKEVRVGGIDNYNPYTFTGFIS